MRLPKLLGKSSNGIFASVVAVAVLAACAGAKPAAKPAAQPTTEKIIPPTATPSQASVLLANLGFGFDLFAALTEEDSGQNLFISPLSVSIALATTYNGASGETREAIAEALRLTGLNVDQINNANMYLGSVLQDIDPKVELAIANSLWARHGFDFKSDFLDINREYFEAEVTSLDFGDPASVGVINGWVDENTRGKIKKIIDKIEPDDVLILINAIYFNGKWSTEFEDNDTKDMPFHLADGSEVQHPMMSQEGNYRYLEGMGFQAVRLAYGENKRLGMYIFLPDEGSSLDVFMGELDDDTWVDWLNQFRRRPGAVTIPRFTMEYEANLNQVLKSLGMAPAFDPSGADFSAMTDVPVFISRVKHKAVVEVNEEGTEAAAVTLVAMAVSAPPEPFSFIADRPFFFAIHDSETDSVLFMGSLFDPQE